MEAPTEAGNLGESGSSHFESLPLREGTANRTKASALNENGIPHFESLPLREGDPPYSAWGLYGDLDELGTLNRLTDELVVETARSEIRTGAR